MVGTGRHYAAIGKAGQPEIDIGDTRLFQRAVHRFEIIKGSQRPFDGNREALEGTVCIHRTEGLNVERNIGSDVAAAQTGQGTVFL